jgi:hypothetical protein
MTKRLPAFVLAAWLPLAGAQGAVLDAACPPAVVGVSDLGYSSYLDGDTIRGSSIDVLREVQRRSGCKLTFAGTRAAGCTRNSSRMNWTWQAPRRARPSATATVCSCPTPTPISSWCC